MKTLYLPSATQNLVALKLSGVGTITDSDSIDTLMHILSRASYL